MSKNLIVIDDPDCEANCQHT